MDPLQPTPKFHPLPVDQFEAGILVVITLHRCGDLRRHNPYHNGAHNMAVRHRLKSLLELAGYPAGVIQAGEFAAICHDLGHPGKTLRWEMSDAPQRFMTNEAYACQLARGLAAEIGFAAPAIELIEEMILGTTFGIPFEPSTPLQQQIAIADIAGFAAGIEAFTQESVNVLLEQPMSSRPETLQNWLQGRLGFLLKFVEPRMTKEARMLWSKIHRELVQRFTILIANKPEHLAPEYTTLLETLTRTVQPCLKQKT